MASTDWRTMFQSDYIASWDLEGKDAVVTISSVSVGELTGTDGRKTKKPIIKFEGKAKSLVGNKTNCGIIAAMYGNNTEHWVGKKIALYPTQCSAFGKNVDCIRIRPTVPK